MLCLQCTCVLFSPHTLIILFVHVTESCVLQFYTFIACHHRCPLHVRTVRARFVLAQSINARFFPPRKSLRRYEALLTCMSVLVNTVWCTASVCFSNTAGMVIWMWWDIWWLKLTVILMSGTMVERLLSTRPSREHMKMSTRKYCVGRGGRAWEWNYMCIIHV